MRRTTAALDVTAILLFVAIGRASHHHAATLGGFLSTLWPFALGLGAGWILAARRAPLRSGLIVCSSTVVVGMVLRVVAGQGTAAAFVVVAFCFLGAMMLGGRRLLSTFGRRLRPST